MISDLNGSLGFRQFLNVANERTCFASCASTFKSTGLFTVVTIPENLPLSDAEKSVLSKGLNFVPLSKKLDEFSVK